MSKDRLSGVVYCYTLPNGKTYVGRTIDESKRKLKHLKDAEAGSHLPFHKALRKYNFNFTYEILKNVEADDKKTLIKLLTKYEGFYITRTDSLIKDNGYNCRNDGDGNGYWSDEMRENMSKVHKGKIVSEETKKRISKSLIGNKYGAGNTTGRKDLEYYSTTPTLNNNFKRACGTNGWNYDEFERIFSEWYVRPSGRRVSKFIFKKRGEQDEQG